MIRKVHCLRKMYSGAVSSVPGQRRHQESETFIFHPEVHAAGLHGCIPPQPLSNGDYCLRIPEMTSCQTVTKASTTTSLRTPGLWIATLIIDNRSDNQGPVSEALRWRVEHTQLPGRKTSVAACKVQVIICPVGG